MSQLTNFEKIREFHHTFSHPDKTTPNLHVFDNDANLVKLRLDLIQEEVKELVQAINDKDMVEVVDALADILYVVYGAGSAFGINLDKAFDLVHKSNMTKACATQEEANLTVEWYKKNMLDTYDTPTSKQVGNYWIVINQSSGKILKSINYSPVDLKNLVFGQSQEP